MSFSHKFPYLSVAVSFYEKIIGVVTATPFMSAEKIKDNMGVAGVTFSVRMIKHTLQRKGFSAKHAAKKPSLTQRMKAPPEDWCKILCTAESTFRLVRGAPAK